MDKFTGTLVDSFSNAGFARNRGVPILTVSAEDIEGECDRRSIFYTMTLWMISWWAFATNCFEALTHKLLKNPSKRLSEILWTIGRSRGHVSSIFFDRFSSYNHQAKYGAAGWISLDLFYNYYDKVVPNINGDLEGFVTDFWMGKMENRQAVTNRLKLATRILTSAFERFSHLPEVRILSIASGSAQAVIAAMLNCPGINIKVMLLDSDPTAHETAEKAFKEAGLDGRYELVKGTTRKAAELCRNFQPHIIEMIGFLDYLSAKKAVNLISGLRESMREGDIFITCNIHGNPEKIFLDWILLWPMIYRNKDQFLDLFLMGGFNHEDILLLYEPFEIHGLAVCQKRFIGNNVSPDKGPEPKAAQA